ncbi:MAG: TRAP transporter fused permease subunit [Mailhella sp.]|nr:TRAP transporter fused permease subunit [Mailhella sp.]
MENRLRAALKPIFTVLAVVLALFQIYTTGGFAVFDSTLQKVAHLALILSLAFLWMPIKSFKKSTEPTILVLMDIALSCAAIAVGVYFFSNAGVILERVPFVDPVTDMDLLFGTLAVVLTLEIVRRTAGLPMVLVALMFICYALFGKDLPGPLRHNGVTYPDLIAHLFLGSDGLFSTPLASASTMIYAFVLFGAFLECTGMSSLFIDLSCLLTKKAKGGPAKVAIFASALFGSISGSAAANVYGTGIFTIPLMKRVGYSPSFSGAVEACASTGGQLMPPIMGAAAFIMADLMGCGYLAVIKAALLPSILYYASLWLMIHFEAVKKNLGTIPAEQVPDKKFVLSRLYYVIPLVFLVVILVSGRSVNFSAFSACIVVIIVGLFKASTRIGTNMLVKIASSAARSMLMITSCCACAGIVVGVMGLTGGGFKFINLITTFVDGNLLLLLIMLMLTCFIVGMGVPTAPAYIIVSVLAVPALVKMGVDPMAANMFLLYHAVLSAITPPVCIAAFAGAAIAEAPAMKTGFQAVKLGFIAFIVPFFFVYEPALLLQGDVLIVMQAALSAAVGLIALASGLQGYLVTNAPIWQRIILVASGLCLIIPGTMTDLGGMGGFAAIFLLQKAMKR